MPTVAAPAALAGRIDAALPQTQCTRCGYPDCAGYAGAIAEDRADINQCPPGGAEGIARLAAITGRPAAPLDPAHGVEAPRTLAVIDEAWCIGCTLCLAACPTDAILGGNKRMHTVIAAHCTGCELCVPACPVDCIAMENASGDATGWQAWSAAQADAARSRYAAHRNRVGAPTAAQRVAAGAVLADQAPDEPVGDRRQAGVPVAASHALTPSVPATAVPAVDTADAAAASRKSTTIDAILARARARNSAR